jgi:hypothetical protein
VRAAVALFALGACALSVATAAAGNGGSAGNSGSAGTPSCTVDGKTWEVKQPVTAIVATKPLFGTQLTINVWGATKTELPYLQITAQWKLLKGQSNTTLKAKNAGPEGPLEAMWLESAQPAASPNDPQPGVHYLEKGELKLIKHDEGAETLTLKVDFTMREGAYDRAAQNAGHHKVDVRCMMDAIPLKVD